MEKKSSHPEWALACKRKGTELRLLNGRYYLYEATSKWNPEKKRSVKITGRLLGSITEADGFVESDKARLRKQQILIEGIHVKEYGITAVIIQFFAWFITVLKEFFPESWQRLVLLAYGRLVYQSPLKNMSFHYSRSYLSEQYPGVDITAKSLSYFLRELGTDRNRIVEFCRSFKITGDCILFDGTDVISHSEQLELSKFGKSKFGTFDDTVIERSRNMINLMNIFSVKLQMPVYYRLLPGNIKDVSAFKLCLIESGIQDAIIIIDKGFASRNNIEALEEELRLLSVVEILKYIIPLPRNSSFIDYEKVKSGDRRLFDGHFKYEARFIWHYTTAVDEKKSVHVFLDDELRNREEKDYLNRVESKNKNYTMDNFHDKQHTFGTLSVISNTGKPAREIYTDYKTRGQVETMIDTLKNIVDADRTYMQNRQALEGWMFINLIALKWYYTLLNLLKKHELNDKYSPADFLLFLSEVKMVKINNRWHLAEITKKTFQLLQKLGIELNVTPDNIGNGELLDTKKTAQQDIKQVGLSTAQQ
jgi:transposase